MKQKQYIVTVEYDGDFRRDNVREYIEVAVRQWRGCLHPDDPLFGIKVAKVSAVLGTGTCSVLEEIYAQLSPKNTSAARKLKALIKEN